MRPSSFTRVVVAWILAAAMLGGRAAAQSGTYPGEPYNGLQITYAVAGATITDTKEDDNWTRTLSWTGTFAPGGVLRVSGVARRSGGWTPPTVSATLAVSVDVDGVVRKHSAELLRDSTADFDVSVPIPAGAKRATLAVELVGIYNVGTRNVRLLGVFRPGPAAPPPASRPQASPSLLPESTRAVQPLSVVLTAPGQPPAEGTAQALVASPDPCPLIATVWPGTLVDLSARASGGTPPYMYQWRGELGRGTARPHEATFVSRAVQRHSVDLTVTDRAGARTSACVQLSVIGLIGACSCAPIGGAGSTRFACAAAFSGGVDGDRVVQWAPATTYRFDPEEGPETLVDVKSAGRHVIHADFFVREGPSLKTAGGAECIVDTGAVDPVDASPAPPGAVPAPPSPQSGAAVAGRGALSGTYAGPKGTMTIIQRGERIGGTYTWGGGGSFEGTVSDGAGAGTWQDARGSGTFRFLFDASQKTVRPFWRTDGEAAWVDGGVHSVVAGEK